MQGAPPFHSMGVAWPVGLLDFLPASRANLTQEVLMKDTRAAIGAIVLASVVALATPLTAQAARVGGGGGGHFGGGGGGFHFGGGGFHPGGGGMRFGGGGMRLGGGGMHFGGGR